VVKTVNQIPECLALLGASGFVGAAVLRQIQSAADSPCDVHLLLHETPLETLPRLATVHRGSLANIPRECLPQKPHIVLHCASRHTDTDGAGLDVNVQGIISLGRAVNAYTRGIVFISSYSVYGDDAQRNIGEDAPVRPQSDLARSRADCESRLIALAHNTDCRVIICRTRFVLGTGDRFVLPGIAHLARVGLKIGSGQQRFSVIDVDDFARILLTLACQSLHSTSSFGPYEIYNVGYSRPISMNEIYEALAEVTPVKRRYWRIPVNALVLRCFERLPSRCTRQLVQRFRLLGYDHYGDVRKLQSRLGTNWLQADPRDVIRRMAAALIPPSNTTG
jgi:nucleoside-diphosphate-sugar epimerase